MLQDKGASPNNALFGRVSALLEEFELPVIAMTVDDKGGNHSRHATRLRELVSQSIVEGTAQARITRVAALNTRLAGEKLNLTPGQSVDIYK